MEKSPNHDDVLLGSLGRCDAVTVMSCCCAIELLS